MMKSKGKLRIISLFIAFIFLITDISIAAPLSFEAPFPDSPEVRLPERSIPSTFKIVPEDFGKVEDLHLGIEKMIFHVQTAHGNYEAQKNIHQILSHLDQSFGVKTILMEGSFEEIQASRVNWFPNNPEKTREINDVFLKNSLLKGSETYLMEAQNAVGLGIEERNLYDKNAEVFADVLRQKEQSAGFLTDMNEVMSRISSHHLNHDLKSFLRKVEAYENETISFETWLEIIKSEAKAIYGWDLADASHQLDIPMLVRLYKIQELQKEFSVTEFEQEKELFLDSLGVETETRAFLESIMAKPIGDLSHNPVTVERAMSMISEKLNGRDVTSFPHLASYWGMLLLHLELDPSLLMQEIEMIETKLFDRLAQNDAEKNLVVLLNNYRILQKLFDLHLTPADYEKLDFGMREQIRPSLILEKIQGMESLKSAAQNLSFNNISDLDELFESAMDFYRYAKERDEVMIRRVEERLEEMGVDRAVVITGGFHAQPFKDYFKNQDYTYALLTPQITSLDDQGYQSYVDAIFRQIPREVSAATLEFIATFTENGVTEKNFVRALADARTALENASWTEGAIEEFTKAARRQWDASQGNVVAVSGAKTEGASVRDELRSEDDDTLDGLANFLEEEFVNQTLFDYSDPAGVIQGSELEESARALVLELWNEFTANNEMQIVGFAMSASDGYSRAQSNEFVKMIIDRFPGLENRILFDMKFRSSNVEDIVEWLKRLNGSTIHEDGYADPDVDFEREGFYGEDLRVLIDYWNQFREDNEMVRISEWGDDGYSVEQVRSFIEGLLDLYPELEEHRDAILNSRNELRMTADEIRDAVTTLLETKELEGISEKQIVANNGEKPFTLADLLQGVRSEFQTDGLKLDSLEGREQLATSIWRAANDVYSFVLPYIEDGEISAIVEEKIYYGLTDLHSDLKRLDLNRDELRSTYDEIINSFFYGHDFLQQRHLLLSFSEGLWVHSMEELSRTHKQFSQEKFESLLEDKKYDQALQYFQGILQSDYDPEKLSSLKPVADNGYADAVLRTIFHPDFEDDFLLYRSTLDELLINAEKFFLNMVEYIRGDNEFEDLYSFLRRVFELSRLNPEDIFFRRLQLILDKYLDDYFSPLSYIRNSHMVSTDLRVIAEGLKRINADPAILNVTDEPLSWWQDSAGEFYIGNILYEEDEAVDEAVNIVDAWALFYDVTDIGDLSAAALIAYDRIYYMYIRDASYWSIRQTLHVERYVLGDRHLELQELQTTHQYVRNWVGFIELMLQWWFHDAMEMTAVEEYRLRTWVESKLYEAIQDLEFSNENMFLVLKNVRDDFEKFAKESRQREIANLPLESFLGAAQFPWWTDAVTEGFRSLLKSSSISSTLLLSESVTLGRLVRFAESELLTIPGIGEEQLEGLKDKLAEFQLTLGTELDPSLFKHPITFRENRNELRMAADEIRDAAITLLETKELEGISEKQIVANNGEKQFTLSDLLQSVRSEFQVDALNLEDVESREQLANAIWRASNDVYSFVLPYIEDGEISAIVEEKIYYGLTDLHSDLKRLDLNRDELRMTADELNQSRLTIWDGEERIVLDVNSHKEFEGKLPQALLGEKHHGISYDLNGLTVLLVTPVESYGKVQAYLQEDPSSDFKLITEGLPKRKNKDLSEFELSFWGAVDKRSKVALWGTDDLLKIVEKEWYQIKAPELVTSSETENDLGDVLSELLTRYTHIGAHGKVNNAWRGFSTLHLREQLPGAVLDAIGEKNPAVFSGEQLSRFFEAEDMLHGWENYSNVAPTVENLDFLLRKFHEYHPESLNTEMMASVLDALDSLGKHNPARALHLLLTINELNPDLIREHSAQIENFISRRNMENLGSDSSIQKLRVRDELRVIVEDLGDDFESWGDVVKRGRELSQEGKIGNWLATVSAKEYQSGQYVAAGIAQAMFAMPIMLETMHPGNKKFHLLIEEVPVQGQEPVRFLTAVYLKSGESIVLRNELRSTEQIIDGFFAQRMYDSDKLIDYFLDHPEIIKSRPEAERAAFAAAFLTKRGDDTEAFAENYILNILMPLDLDFNSSAGRYVTGNINRYGSAEVKKVFGIERQELRTEASPDNQEWIHFKERVFEQVPEYFDSEEIYSLSLGYGERRETGLEIVSNLQEIFGHEAYAHLMDPEKRPTDLSGNDLQLYELYAITLFHQSYSGEEAESIMGFLNWISSFPLGSNFRSVLEENNLIKEIKLDAERRNPYRLTMTRQEIERMITEATKDFGIDQDRFIQFVFRALESLSKREKVQGIGFDAYVIKVREETGGKFTFDVATNEFKQVEYFALIAKALSEAIYINEHIRNPWGSDFQKTESKRLIADLFAAHIMMAESQSPEFRDFGQAVLDARLKPDGDYLRGWFHGIKNEKLKNELGSITAAGIADYYSKSEKTWIDWGQKDRYVKLKAFLEPLIAAEEKELSAAEKENREPELTSFLEILMFSSNIHLEIGFPTDDLLRIMVYSVVGEHFGDTTMGNESYFPFYHFLEAASTEANYPVVGQVRSLLAGRAREESSRNSTLDSTNSTFRDADHSGDYAAQDAAVGRARAAQDRYENFQIHNTERLRELLPSLREAPGYGRLVRRVELLTENRDELRSDTAESKAPGLFRTYTDWLDNVPWEEAYLAGLYNPNPDAYLVEGFAEEVLDLWDAARLQFTGNIGRFHARTYEVLRERRTEVTEVLSSRGVNLKPLVADDDDEHDEVWVSHEPLNRDNNVIVMMNAQDGRIVDLTAAIVKFLKSAPASTLSLILPGADRQMINDLRTNILKGVGGDSRTVNRALRIQSEIGHVLDDEKDYIQGRAMVLDFTDQFPEERVVDAADADERFLVAAHELDQKASDRVGVQTVFTASVDALFYEKGISGIKSVDDILSIGERLRSELRAEIAITTSA